jgi:hypothetical protein
MDKELREQIREIVAESSLCHTSMANRGECEQEIDELTSAILKLFKERMLELIGENRESLAQLIHKHLFNADMTENSPVRNLHIYALVDDLRAELRNAINIEGE